MAAARSLSGPARERSPRLVVLAAAGCASSPQLAAQWTDPQLGHAIGLPARQPGPGGLRRRRPDGAPALPGSGRRRGQRARRDAGLPRAGHAASPPTGRSTASCWPAARSADAKALMVLTLTPAVTDVSQGFSVGIGGFGYGSQRRRGRRRRLRAGRRRPGDHGLCGQRPRHRRRQRPAGLVGERQHVAVVRPRRCSSASCRRRCSARPTSPACSEPRGAARRDALRRRAGRAGRRRRRSAPWW